MVTIENPFETGGIITEEYYFKPNEILLAVVTHTAGNLSFQTSIGREKGLLEISHENITTWNTGISKAGVYEVKASIIDETGIVVDEKSAEFEIVPYGDFRILGVESSRPLLTQGQQGKIDLLVDLKNTGNLDLNLTVEFQVMDPDRQVIFNGTTGVRLPYGGIFNDLVLGSLTWVFEKSGDYIIHVRIGADSNQTQSRVGYFYVSPLLSVKPEKNFSPQRAIPGNRTINYTITLEGIGRYIPPKPADIILLMDRSGSMGTNDILPTRLEAAKNAARIFVNKSREVDRIGMITFSGQQCLDWFFFLCWKWSGYDITVDSNLTANKSQLNASLEGLTPSGYTAMGLAIERAQQMFAEQGNTSHRWIIVLLSDGKDTGCVPYMFGCYPFGSPYPPLDYARNASEHGITIYTVGMGDPSLAELDEKALMDIANATGGWYFNAQSERELEEVFSNIVEGEVAGRAVARKITVTDTVPANDSIVDITSISRNLTRVQIDLMADVSELIDLEGMSIYFNLSFEKGFISLNVTDWLDSTDPSSNYYAFIFRNRLGIRADGSPETISRSLLPQYAGTRDYSNLLETYLGRVLDELKNLGFSKPSTYLDNLSYMSGNYYGNFYRFKDYHRLSTTINVTSGLRACGMISKSNSNYYYIVNGRRGSGHFDCFDIHEGETNIEFYRDRGYLDLVFYADAATVTGEAFDWEDTISVIPRDEIGESSGGTELEWTFGNIYLNEIRNISFQIDLANLQPGEMRKVNSGLKIEYYVPGIMKPVVTTLPAQYLHVYLSDVALDMRSGRKDYHYYDNLSLVVALENRGEFIRDNLTGLLFIEDHHGIGVENVSSFHIATLAPGDSRRFNITAVLSHLPAGNYSARVQLVDDGRLIGEDRVNFTILPDLRIVSTLLIDRENYTSNEYVDITAELRSLSANSDLADLLLRLTILSNGTEIHGEERRMHLLREGTASVKFHWFTGSTDPGDYLVMLDTISGNRTVSSSNVSFTIMPSFVAHVGLLGEATVTPRQIQSGDRVSIYYQVENNGNVPLPKVDIQASFVDPEIGEMVQNLSDRKNIAIGERTNGSFFIDSFVLPPRDYLVMLYGIFNGSVIPVDNKYLLVSGGLADLAIVNMTIVPPAPTEGNTAIISGYLQNTGSALVPEANITLFLDTIAPDNIQSIVNTSNLSEFPVPFTVSWNTSGQGGSRTVLVVADYDNAVPESNESNNMIAIPVRVNRPPSVSITRPTAGEYLSGIQEISWTSHDEDGDGLSFNISYSVDSTNWSPLAVELPDSPPHYFDTTAISDGGYYLRMTVTDGYSVRESVSDRFFVDNTPPYTSIVLSGTPGTAGWYLTDVAVTLSPTDATSGVASTYYSLDGVNFTLGTSVTVSTAGGHTVTYYSVDTAGNREVPKNVTFKIDKTPPAITILSPLARDYAHLETITAAFGAVDGVSGMAAINATLDGSPVGNGEVVDLSGYSPGDHTFRVTAKDMAGLTSTKAVTFRVLASSTLKNASIGLLRGIGTSDKHALKEIEQAIEHIERSLGLKKKLKHKDDEDDDSDDDHTTSPLWLGPHRIDPRHGHKVFNEEKTAVKHLLRACEQKEDKEEDDEKSGEKNDDKGKDKDKDSKEKNHHDDDSQDKDEALLSCTFNATAMEVITNLLLADALLANTSIKDAEFSLAAATHPGKVWKEIERANHELGRAYSEQSRGRYAKAIDRFKHAWEHAQHALKHAGEKEEKHDDEEEKENHKEKDDDEDKTHKGDDKDHKKEGKDK